MRDAAPTTTDDQSIARPGRPRRGRRRSSIFLLTLTTCVVLWFLIGQTVEQRIGLPLLYLLRGPVAPPAKVALVALDERTVDDLALDAAALARRRPAAAACMPPETARALAGVRNIETLPRAVHGCLINRLTARGARAIVMDVHFKAAESPADDAFLALAMLDAGNVRILEEIARDADTGAITRRAPARVFETAAAGTGFFAVADDPDGAFGHVARFDGFPDARPVYAPLLPDPDAPLPDAVPSGGVRFSLLNLYDAPNMLPTIRLADVLDDLAATELVRDAVVFVGAAEPDGAPERDSFASLWPGGAQRVAGVELMATAYLNGLQGAWLRRPPVWAQTIQTLALCAGMIAAALRRGHAGAVVFTLIVGGALAGASTAFSHANLWLPVAFVAVIAAPLALIAALTARYITSRRSLRRLVPDTISRHAEEADAFVAADHTVVFVDLAGSTSFGDRFGAAPLHARLDTVFDAVVTAVESHNGYIVKFTGDGCIALFAEQGCAGRDADCACQAALQISEALEAINRAGAAQGVPPIRLRLGVQSGPVIVGYVGAFSRGVVDAVGDAVNTAARLEDYCKTAFPGDHCAIAIGSATAARLKGARFALRSVGETMLRGKLDPIEIFQLVTVTKP